MSLSENQGSLPVVRHFYPIDPVTSLQQSEYVLNSPSAPIVAPIQPYTFPQPRERKTKPVKRKRDEAELDVEGPAPSTSTRHVKRAKHVDKPSPKRPTPIRLPPRAKRSTPYILVPSIDTSLYKPISYGVKTPKLSRGDRILKPFPGSLPSWALPTGTRSTSPLTELSSDSDSGSDHSLHPIKTTTRSQGSRTVKQEEAKQELESTRIIEDVDPQTSCHQCRRKTLKPKMRCRHVDQHGTVCVLMYCKSCIISRYDEVFEPEHLSWHCPRCRELCNCSICLRKRGLGYLLKNDGAKRGTFTMGAKPTRGKKRGKELGHVPAQRWLARQGLVVGNDKWMKKQQRLGVRYYAGMKPPPLDGPSSYKEARLSDLLAPLVEEQLIDNVGPTLEPLVGGMAPRVDAPTQVREDDGAGPSLEIEAGAPTGVSNPPAFPSTPKRHTPSTSPPEHDLSQDMDDASGALYGDTEDLPGLTATQTRHVRLFIGNPRHLSRTKKRGRKVRKPAKLTKRKVESDNDDDDYKGPSGQTGFKIRLPAIRARRGHTGPSAVQSIQDGNIGHISPPAVQLIEDDKKIEYKDDEQPEEDSSYGGSEQGQSFLEDGDVPATPSPPPLPAHEPVLVPTEQYTPKLGIAHVKDPEARFSQPYWGTLGSQSEQDQTRFVYDDNPAIDDLSPSQGGSTNPSSNPGSSRDSLVQQPADTVYTPPVLPSFLDFDRSWVDGEFGLDTIPPLHFEQLMHSTD